MQDRAKLAYDTYRGGFRAGATAPPHWDALEPWVRDSITVAYAQGKLDKNWQRGFPPKTGWYLVKLAGGERCWTKYTMPGDEGADTWGDPRRPGWTCLTGSRATVVAWCEVPDYRA